MSAGLKCPNRIRSQSLKASEDMLLNSPGKLSKYTKRHNKKSHIPIRVKTNAIKADKIAINASYIIKEDMAEGKLKKQVENKRKFDVKYPKHVSTLNPPSRSCNQKARISQYPADFKRLPSKRTVASPIITRNTNQRSNIPFESEASRVNNDEENLENKIENNDRDNLHNEIMKWYNDIPICSNYNPSSVRDTGNEMTLDFIERVYNILTKEDETYEGRLRDEIDAFLNGLHLWCPNKKRDYDSLKDDLKNNLLNIIETLKMNGFYNQRDATNNLSYDLIICQGSNNLKSTDIESIIENEILHWIMEMKFKTNQNIGSSVDFINIKDMFITNIGPILKHPLNTENCKILKSRIMDNLHKIQKVLDIPKTRKEYFNLLAEDLANRLNEVKSKYNRNRWVFDRDENERDLSNMDSKQSQNRVTAGKSFTILKTNNFNINDNGTKHETAHILMDYLESNVDEKINKAKMKITNTAQRSQVNIRDVLADSIINADYCTQSSEKSGRSAVISVYTSEQDLSDNCCYPVTSTPKKGKLDGKRELKLNQEETTYMENAVVVIKNWMETLPKNFDDDQGFKETAAMNLAGELIDELKIEQIAPKAIRERDKVISYIVYRWLIRFDVFEQDFNEDLPQISDLVQRLNKVNVQNLTRFPAGERQATENVIHMEKENIKLNTDANERQTKRCCTADCLNNAEQSKTTEDANTEQTLKELVVKFMEHNNIVDDTLARDAFGELLKYEFRKLNPSAKKKVGKCEEESKPPDISIERLDKELQYILLVSDWLKNIPIHSSFNTPQNRKRIDFVNDLANSIFEIEEERRKKPATMDYDSHTKSVISQFVHRLPILPEHNSYITLMVDELMGKIIASRASQPSSAIQTLSVTDSSIKKQNISEFFDNYININARHFADDPMKMDAWLARVIKELKNIAQESDESDQTDAHIIDKINEVPFPTDESVRLFGLELEYAKEISDWLNNLPLVPSSSLTENEKVVKMICELAERFSEEDRIRLKNVTNSQHNTINDYIANWIQCLPLDKTKEIVLPVLIQQLNRRIDKVRTKQDEFSIDNPTNEVNKFSKKTQNKVNKSPLGRTKCKQPCVYTGKRQGQSTCSSNITEHPGNVVFEVIDEWSKSLPIKADTKETENSIKDTIAIKIFQKVGDLSVDPETTRDPTLFHELLAEEVSNQIENLPATIDSQKKKENLKNKLVEKVMDAKALVDERTAGDSYKKQLENVIEVSVPNPVHNKQWFDPGFEIYKNHLADMFILENFDHGNDAVKARYERRIRNEIDKYCQYAQKRNAVPLSKEELNNELMSALFKVPIPNEKSTIEEVEEAKTRCEVDTWFAELPMREAETINENLEWDKILSVLAKRLYEIEKHDSKPDDKMHKEIMKWLVRFPLLPDKNINLDDYANDLQRRLKETKQERKCVTASENTKKDKKGKAPKKVSITEPQNVNLGLSQIAGPSTQKKSADLISEILEKWSAQLPLSPNVTQDQNTSKLIKENIVTNIIMKLTELNSNIRIFNDDVMYNYFFDEELDRILSNLPLACDEYEKNTMKRELIEAVNNIKPLIREEKSRHEYKKELKSTIDTMLEGPHDGTADKIATFNDLKDEIVDNFILYHYNRGDDEERQIYKNELQNTVVKYYRNVIDKSENSVDPLMKHNQLVCELTKVPVPSEDAVEDEVEEIRIKNEIKDFFQDLSLPEDSKEKMIMRNKMKQNLAKYLHEISKGGLNDETVLKMKNEIGRCMNKIGIDVPPEKIDSLVKKIHAIQAKRKPTTVSNLINNQKTQDTKFLSPQGLGSGKINSLPVSPSDYKDFGCGVASSTRKQPMQYFNRQLENQKDSQMTNTYRGPAKSELLSEQTEGGDKQKYPLGPRKEGLCKCRQLEKKFKGRPRHGWRVPKFCDECPDVFTPMWMPMPYCFPPGWF